MIRTFSRVQSLARTSTVANNTALVYTTINSRRDAIQKRQFAEWPLLFGTFIATANMINMPQPRGDLQTYRTVAWSIGKGALYGITFPFSAIWVGLDFMTGRFTEFPRHIHPFSRHGGALRTEAMARKKTDPLASDATTPPPPTQQ